MPNAPDEVISTVDRSTLTPIVRQALDDATAEVIDWGYHTLQQVTEVEERAAAFLARCAAAEGRPEPPRTQWTPSLRVAGSEVRSPATS